MKTEKIEENIYKMQLIERHNNKLGEIRFVYRYWTGVCP